WKPDFEGVALGTYGLDLNRLARRLRRSNDRLCREVEGNAEHVGIFHVEQPFFIQFIGLAPQCASNDLLAKKLGAEGADTENMCDGISVPPFRKHRHRNHATNGPTELAWLSDRIHDL